MSVRTEQKLLGEHASLPFNPLLANAFFRAGEIEAWGRGIHRIFQACREAGTPEPTLHFDANALLLEFPFASEYLTTLGARVTLQPEQGERWGERWGEKWGEKTTATRLHIVQAMRRNPRSVKRAYRLASFYIA